jgi:multidrug efflux pump subunit AcrB
MPDVDQGSIAISVNTRPGLKLDELDKTLVQLEERLAGYEDVERYSLTGGGSTPLSSSSASATLSVYLRGDRKMSTDEVVEDLRKKTRDFTNCSVDVDAQSMMSMLSGSGVQVNIMGTDIDALTEASAQLEQMMWQNSNVGAVSSTLTSGSPQAEIAIDPVMAAAYGLSPVQVMMEVSNAVQGSKATTLRMDGRDYEVRWNTPRAAMRSFPIWMACSLPARAARRPRLVRLPTLSIPTARRASSAKTTSILSASPVSCALRRAARIATDLSTQATKMQLPDGVEIYMGGSMEMMVEEMTALVGALLTAVLLVFMVMAVQFNSMRFSIVVMISIPFALIGSMLMLLISGTAISMTSLMGIIMLVGIVVNNGILLIDTANRLQDDEGMDATDALVQAGMLRLRPILMTTLTTVLSMIPLALGIGTATEMMQSMAYVIIGGLVASTILTIFLIPTFYLLFQGKRKRKAPELQLQV